MSQEQKTVENPTPVPVAPKPAEKKATSKFLDVVLPFALGGASGMTATCFIQPVDMVKVRIQIKNEEVSKLKAQGKAAGSVSPFVVIKEIMATGGVRTFYRGIDSALTRQLFYTTTRLGIYNKLFVYIKQQNQGKDLSFGQKSLCSLTAGFIGSIVGNPADLALIRMQNDTALKPEERRNYKNVVDAFSRIIKEEGVLALWRGCIPTVIRAMSLNLGMLGPYDEVKERLDKWTGTKDALQTRLIASAVSGFLASFFSLPFDNAKTKMQKMKVRPDGKFEYANIFDAMMKTVRREGVVGLWVGFPTYYFRIAPHAMITLICQDLFRDKVKVWRQKNKI
jgi:solute carrier family 25 oxoglutarate transporter 11